MTNATPEDAAAAMMRDYGEPMMRSAAAHADRKFAQAWRTWRIALFEQLLGRVVFRGRRR
jgi:hypothetical protein